MDLKSRLDMRQIMPQSSAGVFRQVDSTFKDLCAQILRQCNISSNLLQK